MAIVHDYDISGCTKSGKVPSLPVVSTALLVMWLRMMSSPEARMALLNQHYVTILLHVLDDVVRVWRLGVGVNVTPEPTPGPIWAIPVCPVVHSDQLHLKRGVH